VPASIISPAERAASPGGLSCSAATPSSIVIPSAWGAPAFTAERRGSSLGIGELGRLAGERGLDGGGLVGRAEQLALKGCLERERLLGARAGRFVPEALRPPDRVGRARRDLLRERERGGAGVVVGAG